MTTCGKCGNHSFRIEKGEPSGSNFYIYYVQCISCGNPVGVLEYANSAAMIEGIEKKINNLVNEIQQISYDISYIKSEISRK